MAPKAHIDDTYAVKKLSTNPRTSSTSFIDILLAYIFTMHSTDSLQQIFIKTEFSFTNDLHEKQCLKFVSLRAVAVSSVRSTMETANSANDVDTTEK